MEKITIEFSEENIWTVKQGDKSADHLGWDEMLGLITALTMPESKPCLQWMKTRKEHAFQKSYFRKLAKRNKVNPPEMAQNQ